MASLQKVINYFNSNKFILCVLGNIAIFQNFISKIYYDFIISEGDEVLAQRWKNSPTTFYKNDNLFNSNNELIFLKIQNQGETTIIFLSHMVDIF